MDTASIIQGIIPSKGGSLSTVFLTASSTTITPAGPAETKISLTAEDSEVGSPSESEKAAAVFLESARNSPNHEVAQVSVNEKENGEHHVSVEEATQAAKQVESFLNETEVRFSIDLLQDGSHPLKFQVVDKETGKVVRQFPPEELLEVAKQLGDPSIGKGILLTSTV